MSKGQNYGEQTFGAMPSVRADMENKRGTNALLGMFVALTVELLLFAIGFEANVNSAVVATFFCFLIYTIFREPKLMLEFFQVFVMITFNILGVFCCERGIFLEELQLYSFYSNSLAPLVIFWTLFIGFVSYASSHMRKQAECTGKWSISEKWLNIILLIAVTLELAVFSQIASRPYFSVGADRFEYRTIYMSGWVSSLKSQIVVFAPVAAMSIIGGKRKLAIVYFSLLVLIYVWAGDKFGAYFFVLYIVGLVICPRIDAKTARNVLIIFCVAIIAFIGIVFVQNSILKGYDLDSNFDYLGERLSQQGEVWWSVYTQSVAGLVDDEGFESEIDMAFSEDPMAYSDAGQWKMMKIAAHGSPFVLSRIATKVPYTATTTASLFYYFSWPGCIVFYIAAAFVVAAFVYTVVNSFATMRILKSIVLTEIMVMMNNLIFASNIADFLSIKFLILLAALFFLNTLRPEPESHHEIHLYKE